MSVVGGYQPGLYRESTLIREALQQYRQAPDDATGLAVTKQALDQVSLQGSPTERKIAESTLEAVGRCRILPQSAAKTYEVALSTMLGVLPPSVGVATVMAAVGQHSMNQIDPSDGLRIGESFLYEAGKHGNSAEQGVATAGQAISNTLAPDTAAVVLGSALTTLVTLPGQGQAEATTQDGLRKFQERVSTDLKSDSNVSPEERTRVDDHLQTMLKTGRPTIPDQEENLHFLIAKPFRS